MRVKICGINSVAAFDAAVEAGADYLGLVFFPASPRAVSPQQAAALSTRASGGPKRVGLFVAPAIEDVAQLLQTVRLDALQFHGAGDLAPFRRFGLPLWRAVGVGTPADLPSSLDGADEVLFDAKAPANATRPGGNASSFDWKILRGWAGASPWWLAGGLTPANVAAAIRASGASAVDVSSGVESQPGVKNPDLIAAFVRAAKEDALC